MVMLHDDQQMVSFLPNGNILYLPCSSFKGAIRDRLNREERNISENPPLPESTLFTASYITLLHNRAPAWRRRARQLISRTNTAPFFRRFPYFTIIFAIMILSAYPSQSVSEALLLNVKPDNYFRVYPLFSYVFVHNDIAHLVVNLIVLLLSGCLIEINYGQVVLAVLTFSSAFGGSTFYVSVEIKTSLTGVSAVVYGYLIFMLIECLLLPEKKTRHLTTIGLIIMLLSFTNLKLVLSTFEEICTDDTADMAHLGGAICSVPCLLLFSHRCTKPILMRMGAALLVLICMCTIVVGTVVHSANLDVCPVKPNATALQ
ncbi:hypothetical protein QR680_003510 [Steinernema hermaphroditum]|uniref:rhomboid protease n=1 Tax=Steinernema hermaphroditum TaxID=289476 RepID=A0AA39HKN2_9BILA|nr:hypothetical protein QR680_003510 [Steinernema hermaphroditum]